MVGSQSRERAAIASALDPHGSHAEISPSVLIALLPQIVVILVNLAMSLFVLPRLDRSYLAEQRWGATSLAAVAGVWPMVTALSSAIATSIALNWRRLPSLRANLDAGANASPPALSVASLVGFGAVVAALPAFAMVRDWVASICGVATNILAALTGSASGVLIIALDALGDTYLRLTAEQGIDPALLYPRQPAAQWHCGDVALRHDPRESYRDIVIGCDRERAARPCRRNRLGFDLRIVLS